MDVYILQLNYWRGPIDARTFYQNSLFEGAQRAYNVHTVYVKMLLPRLECDIQVVRCLSQFDDLSQTLSETIYSVHAFRHNTVTEWHTVYTG